MTTSSSSSMKRALSREPDGDRRPTTFIQDSTAKKRRVSESGDSVTASSVSSPSTSAPLTNTTVKIEDEEEDSLQSQPSRWLVTEGSKHYPTPPNCKKRNDNWAKNRKDWLKDQRYFFDWKGMEIQKVLWRDDGIAVDWILKNPTQPVWNDTLTRPTAQELAELNGPHRSPTLPASPVPAPLVQPALNRLAENSVSQSIAQPVDPRTPTTSPPRSYSAYSPTTSPNNPLNYGSGSQIPNTSPSVPTASPALTTSMLPPAALPSQVSAVQSSSIRTSVPPIVTLQDENTLVRPPPTERLPSRPAIVVPQPPVIPMEDVIDLTESPPPSSAAHPSRMAVDERPLDIALALKRSVPTNRPTPSSHISLPVGPSHLAQKSQMPSHLKREPTETLRLVNEFIIAYTKASSTTATRRSLSAFYADDATFSCTVTPPAVSRTGGAYRFVPAVAVRNIEDPLTLHVGATKIGKVLSTFGSSYTYLPRGKGPRPPYDVLDQPAHISLTENQELIFLVLHTPIVAPNYAADAAEVNERGVAPSDHVLWCVHSFVLRNEHRRRDGLWTGEWFIISHIMNVLEKP